MNHHQTELEQTAVSISEKILNGDLGIIAGSMKLSEMRMDLNKENDPTYEIFAVVSSETDHLPIGSSRQYWNAESLKKKDEEIKGFEDFYRSDVIEACQAICTTTPERSIQARVDNSVRASPQPPLDDLQKMKTEQNESEWRKHRLMSEELRAICITAIDTCKDIESSVRKNKNAIDSVEITTFDQSYLEFLDGQIAIKPRGEEWNKILKIRRRILSEYVGRELARCRLKFEARHYSITIDPITSSVIHWEAY